MYILYIEIKFLTLYKMALKIEEFDINCITAVGGKSINGLKFTNFRYKILISFHELSFMEE